MTERRPLVLVSNRGPVTYQDDGSVKRGTGGLVTALTGLASHRDAVWIASAMTERDVEVTREHGGRPFEVEAPEGGTFRVRFVESDDEAYEVTAGLEPGAEIATGNSFLLKAELGKADADHDH